MVYSITIINTNLIQGQDQLNNKRWDKENQDKSLY